MKPREARKTADLRKLAQDNTTVGNYWMLIDGTSVIVCEQIGPQQKQYMVLPRQTFNALADWYFRDQAATPSRKETR